MHSFAFVEMDEFTQSFQCHIATEAFFVGLCDTSDFFWDVMQQYMSLSM